jgi:hypothetical protein
MNEVEYNYPPPEELHYLLLKYAAATAGQRSAIAKNEQGENLKNSDLLNLRIFNQIQIPHFQKLAA